MKSLKDDRITPFILEGKFLGFVLEGSKLKYLRMSLVDRELEIKLSKQSRTSVGTVLCPQDWIQVCGEEVCDSRTCRLKAHQITKVLSQMAPGEKAEVLTPLPCTTEASAGKSKPESQRKFKIMVCQKSGCQKKGGKKQLQTLTRILSDRGLNEHVTIQETGCLGKCSMAPNTMLVPGKKRLSGMSPQAIAELLTNLQKP